MDGNVFRCSKTDMITENTDAIVCQLCREPIWNFLCIDCIGKNVEEWLPKGFTQQFVKFHTTIKNHFHTMIADNFEPCLDCRKLNETPLCPYCYTHEVYHWISASSADIARQFSKIFFFYPFEGSEFIRSEQGPIQGVMNERANVGMCDVCGEYSDILQQLNGGWLCEVCKE